jgi:hypothetical protein
MDVQDYLKKKQARADSKLFQHIEDLRVLYAGNASFATMCKYLSEQHGVTVAIPSVWEFCGRHFAELLPARHSVKRSGPTHVTRLSQALNGPARNSVDAHDTQSSHQLPTVPTTAVQPQPVFSVNAPQPLPVVHNAALAPATQTTNVQPSAPRVKDTPANAAYNDHPENTNEGQIHPSFTPQPETSPGNIVQPAASPITQPDAPVNIELFGPAGNLRKPHDLNTPAAKERLARFRKAREEGKI